MNATKRLACLLLCFLPACGSGSGSGAPPPPDTSNVGRWSGTWTYQDVSVRPNRTLSNGSAEIDIAMAGNHETYECRFAEAGSGDLTTISIPPGDTWTIITPDGKRSDYFEYGGVSKNVGVATAANGSKLFSLTIELGKHVYKATAHKVQQ